MELNFFQLISARESCRSYDFSRMPEKDKLQKCLEAAQIAPSACNSQPWHLTAVTDSALVRQLGETVVGQTFPLNVPAFFVVTETHAVLTPRMQKLVESQYFAQIDTGIVATHICLAATAQGLSTCMIGWFDEPQVRKLLGLEQGPVRLLIAVGYAATDKLREKQRKLFKEITSFVE